MWIDHTFNVIECSKHVAKLAPSETLHAIPISWIFPSSVCYKQDKINVTADDVAQGSIGDCWLLSAFAAVAQKTPASIRDCILYDNKTAGFSVIILRQTIFYVDHLVPVVVENKQIKRILAPKASQDEYWPIILEKAFIKLFKSNMCPTDILEMNTHKRLSKGIPLDGYNYSDVNGGFPRWALSIILNVQIDPLRTSSQKDWCRILKDDGDFITIACACTSSEHDDSISSDGFVYGHAYSVIGVDSEKRLIRVRNPWATYESTIYDDFSNDGEFWVSEQTFIDKFPVACLVRVQRNQKHDRL